MKLIVTSLLFVSFSAFAGPRYPFDVDPSLVEQTDRSGGDYSSDAETWTRVIDSVNTTAHQYDRGAYGSLNGFEDCADQLDDRREDF